MDDNITAGAIAVLLLVGLTVAAFATGSENARAQIQHECKSFGATVINAEKFRCEFVKQ
jgi:hypothetical protein